MKKEGDITLAQMFEHIIKRKLLLIIIMLFGIIGGVTYSFIMGNRWLLTVNIRSIDMEFFLRRYFTTTVLPELEKDVSVEYQTELVFPPGEEKPRKQVVKLKFVGSRKAVKRSFEHLKEKYIQFKIEEKINNLIKEMEKTSGAIGNLEENLKLIEKKKEMIKNWKRKYPVIRERINLDLSNTAYFPPELQLFALEYELKLASIRLKIEKGKLQELKNRISEYRKVSGLNDKLTGLFCSRGGLTEIPWHERQPICLAIDRFEAYPLKKVHANPVRLSIFWGLAGLFLGVFLSLFIGLIKEVQD